MATNTSTLAHRCHRGRPPYRPSVGEFDCLHVRNVDSDCHARQGVGNEGNATATTRIEAAVEAERESNGIAIKEKWELNRQTIPAMSTATSILRNGQEQRSSILYAIAGTILAASLLWLIYRGGRQAWPRKAGNGPNGLRAAP